MRKRGSVDSDRARATDEDKGATSPVKRDPLGLRNEHETRGDEQLCEIVGRDTHLVVSLKIDARFLQ